MSVDGVSFLGAPIAPLSLVFGRKRGLHSASALGIGPSVFHASANVPTSFSSG
jgi:hypothetical protein